MEARVERVEAGGKGDRNAWVIGDDDEVVVIDPGGDADAVIAQVGEREILAVICTHGHERHVAAAPEVAGVTLEVLHTPGHTPGSVSIYCDDLGVVFSGDTLLADGPCPHTGEYPDFAAQLSAIGSELLTLPGTTRVLPGHGEEITIAAAEKSFDAWVTAGPVRPD